MRRFPMIALMLFAAMVLLCVSCGDDDDDNDSSSPTDDDTDDDDTGDDDADDDGGDDDTWPPLPDDDDDTGDDDTYWPGHLLPGPDEDGYDADLEAKARLFDRQFYVFNAAGMALNSDTYVPLADTENRELITDFLQETDGWDFESYSGKAVFDVIAGYNAVAGLYAGVGVATDAFRYGVLRDQGYDQGEIDRARQFLTDALESMHVAVAITGVPGVIARGFLRTDIPGGGGSIVTTPLFDGNDNPLPPEKDNGTWREDNSGGLYPNYKWIDSCSRDMILGWCAALAGAWEVIKDDASFSDDLKDQMQEDARQVGLSLAVVREDGFDLEIHDADGRTTYNGYLNENCYDRVCLPWVPIKSGSFALMSLGIVGSLAYVAEDDDLNSYLYDELIGERHLDQIALNNEIGTDLWIHTNYSSTNMMFQGAVLAIRYVQDDIARNKLRQALQIKMYDKPGWPRQPNEIAQSLFDFVYASGMAGADVDHDMNADPDPDAMARGVQTLKEFPAPPFFTFSVTNCDETEIAAGHCVCEDGVTEIDLVGPYGWNDDLVSVQPIPMRLRPASNYYWRSNPYKVNGDGDGSGLLGGVDFRYAYWLGRWTR